MSLRRTALHSEHVKAGAKLVPFARWEMPVSYQGVRQEHVDETRNPIEAGLGWCCKEATGFIGAEAVASAGEAGTEQKLAPFVLTGPGIPREGNPVMDGDREVGVVTSGTLSPCLEQGIGMGYVAAELAEPGSELEIDVRGKRKHAQIESKPLYRKET